MIIIGNLGSDPELRYMPDGNAVTNHSIATNESWKDQLENERYTTEIIADNMQMIGSRDDNQSPQKTSDFKPKTPMKDAYSAMIEPDLDPDDVSPF